MIRRRFLSTLAALVGGLFAARPAFANLKGSTDHGWPGGHNPPQNPEQFKRVFRHDGTAWKEIQWEEIRKGDKLVCVGIFDGVLTDFAAFEATSDYRPDFLGVTTGYDNNLLPRIWGNPRGNEVQLEVNPNASRFDSGAPMVVHPA